MVVFTTALFLSGYAIQQRTLRDLREAIKPSPRPKPQIFLPDRFKSMTTELEDGTVVVVDLDFGEDKFRPPSTEKQIVIEVKPTVEETENKSARDDDIAEEPGENKHREEASNSGDENEQNIGAEVKGRGKGEGEAKKQKKLSRAERRRLIKEEIQRLAQYDKPMLYQRRLW